jgi:hypothetical protein
VEGNQCGPNATACVFFDAAKPDSIRHALGEVLAASWDDDAIEALAERLEDRFIQKLCAIVLGERAQEPVLV